MACHPVGHGNNPPIQLWVAAAGSPSQGCKLVTGLCGEFAARLVLLHEHLSFSQPKCRHISLEVLFSVIVDADGALCEVWRVPQGPEGVQGSTAEHNFEKLQ